MTICIELSGNRLSRRGNGAASDRRLTDEDFARLKDWSARYRSIRSSADDAALKALGQEMFRWLDGSQKWLAGLGSEGAAAVEFRTTAVPDARGKVFISAPWELLANETGFLAMATPRPLALARRLGRPSATPVLVHCDVAALFMAASAAGQAESACEREEAVIIEATRGLTLDLAVEDSGALDALAERLRLERPLDVVHLSCAGGRDGDGCLLLFEDAYGRASMVHPARLLRDAFLGKTPPLLFLSLSHSVDDPQKAANADFAIPLAAMLVQTGFPAVLSWSGPVAGSAAALFARDLYGRLASGASIEDAAAFARQSLVGKNGEPERDWHLARVYLGEGGGGPVCALGQPTRRRPIGQGYGRHGDRHNLLQTLQEASGAPAAHRLLAAGRRCFVGRRRETQAILQVFKETIRPGVLIYGRGRCGKTSLAAHAAHLLSLRLNPVVMTAGGAPLSIFSAFLRACPPGSQRAVEHAWLGRVAQDPAALRPALEDMLRGPLNGDSAVLFFLDNVERVLDLPKEGHGAAMVKNEHAGCMRAVLEAFAAVAGQSDSRLLLASRHPFVLAGAGGADPAQRLHGLALGPLSERGRLMQMHARLRIEGRISRLDARMQERIIATAGGDAGLQDILTSAALEDVASAGLALAALGRHLANSAAPAEQKTAEFLEALLLKSLLGAVDKDGRALLRAATAFSIPVPEAALIAAAQALGAGDCQNHIRRLANLSLLDRQIVNPETGESRWQVNRVVRQSLMGEVKGLKAAEASCAALADVSFPPAALNRDEQALVIVDALAVLRTLWAEESREWEVGGRPEAIELMRLSELARDWPFMGETAAGAALWLFERQEPLAAARLAEQALRHLDGKGAPPCVRLLRIASTLASRLGQEAEAAALLDRGLNADVSGFAQASLWLDWGARLAETGAADEALEWLEKAKTEFWRLGATREHAAADGLIARILEGGADVDAAAMLDAEAERVAQALMTPDVAASDIAPSGLAADAAALAEIVHVEAVYATANGLETAYAAVAYAEAVHSAPDLEPDLAQEGRQPAGYASVVPVGPADGHEVDIPEDRFPEAEGPDGTPDPTANGVYAHAATGAFAGDLHAAAETAETWRDSDAAGSVVEAFLPSHGANDLWGGSGDHPAPLHPVSRIADEAVPRDISVLSRAWSAQDEEAEATLDTPLEEETLLEEELPKDETPAFDRADSAADRPAPPGAWDEDDDSGRDDSASDVSVNDVSATDSSWGVSDAAWASPFRGEDAAPNAVAQHSEETAGDAIDEPILLDGRAETLNVWQPNEESWLDSGEGQPTAPFGASLDDAFLDRPLFDEAAVQAEAPGEAGRVHEAPSGRLEGSDGREEGRLAFFEEAERQSGWRDDEAGAAQDAYAGHDAPPAGFGAAAAADAAFAGGSDADPGPAAPAPQQEAAVDAAHARSEFVEMLIESGGLDQALYILREEAQPDFERRGDLHGLAATAGRIADIHFARDELDEALRVRCEEELPLCERLGDPRERALVMGRIADILQARGQLDEALRIRCEDEAPVLQRLGDARSLAAALGKIADILHARGQLEEALRIRIEEEAPVYQRLGDVRAHAITMGKVADLLEDSGELDEALRIRREEELPAYEQLGDVRLHTGAMGRIADILYTRGDLDEALRIHEQERLPIAEQLGDTDSMIHILWRTSRIRMEKGMSDQQTFEHVRGDLSQAYTLAKQLTRLDAICATASDLGAILAAMGARDQAMPLLVEARDGYMQLGWTRSADQIDEMLRQL